jgi:integrase
MARPPKKRVDHRGRDLPAGIYPVLDDTGQLSAYKARWREDDADGVTRHSAKSFSITDTGSADAALAEASLYREQALKVVQIEGSVLRGDPAERMTVNELFAEWCVGRGAELTERYCEKVARCWDREIASRHISRVRLGRLSQDPALITRFHDELLAAGVKPANRAEALKTLRAILRWGRRRHPSALTVELSGLFEIPSTGRKRLAYAADAYGLERIIEAVLARDVHDDLLALRDAAFVAAMGFTVAARPSEWLYSATWGDVHPGSVELQRQKESDDGAAIGLKTGARAALLLSSAAERLATYRRALEDRFGEQPSDALVFQALGPEGPLWAEDDNGRVPLAWDYDDYKNWTSRVWRPARGRAAKLADAPAGLASMRFYDCRHTAISMALHSTLAMGPYGMNLHNLAGWAGHDVQTLQRYYAHVIARYQGVDPIDLEAECLVARARVGAAPAFRD